jgi:hypothetical protein
MQLVFTAFRLRGQRTEKILEPLSSIMNDFIPDYLHSIQIEILHNMTILGSKKHTFVTGPAWNLEEEKRIVRVVLFIGFQLLFYLYTSYIFWPFQRHFIPELFELLYHAVLRGTE